MENERDSTFKPSLRGLGVAIIYEHMLSIYINSLKSGKNFEEKKCYLCDLVEIKEQHTIEAPADRLSELIEYYRDSETILCKKHYEELMLLLLKRGPKLADKPREIQIKSLERIKDLIGLPLKRSSVRKGSHISA